MEQSTSEMITTGAVPSYVYKPLDESSIRIIELRPAKARTDPLHIRLKEVSLPEALQKGPVPEYEALSYVWGAKHGDRELNCDGKGLLVTANCEKALRYLRHNKKSRTLWIDAICIDQSNDEEKSIQVQRMKDIYQQAARVVIWLGEANLMTAPAFRYFGGLVNRKLPSKVHLSWYRLVTGTQKYAQRVRKAKAQQTSGNSVEYLREILDNPYFRRIWTVQEAALATDAVVLCGEVESPWRKLSDGVAEFIAAEPSFTEVQDGIGRLVQIDNKAQYFEDHRRSSQLRYLASLPAAQQELIIDEDGNPRLHQIRFLLKTAHSHEAFEPKDRVYGLYQLFLDLGVALPAPSYDQSQTVESVFAAATKAIIRGTKTLSVFDNTVVAMRDSTLPSWAQEFRHGLEYTYDILWKASKESEVNLERLDASEVLRLDLDGLLIGCVSQRGGTLPSGPKESSLLPFDDENFPNPHWMSMLAACRSWLGLLDEQSWSVYQHTGERPLEALFQLLLCQAEELEEADSDLREGYEFWHSTVHELAVSPLPYDKIQALLDYKKTPYPRWTDDLDAMLFLKMVDVEDKTLAAFFFIVWNLNKERCLFCTSTGHLGIGPKGLQLDDSIVIFAGATMPMVIRPSGTSFKLVGPAILHGAMQGELWQIDSKDDSGTLQLFSIS